MLILNENLQRKNKMKDRYSNYKHFIQGKENYPKIKVPYGLSKNRAGLKKDIVKFHFCILI